MWLHLDNCSLFNSKMSFQKYDEYGFKRPPQPAYAPDAAPSDFFLFGFAKNSLKGSKLTSLEDFKEKLIIEVFNSISKATSIITSNIVINNRIVIHILTKALMRKKIYNMVSSSVDELTDSKVIGCFKIVFTDISKLKLH